MGVLRSSSPLLTWEEIRVSGASTVATSDVNGRSCPKETQAKLNNKSINFTHSSATNLWYSLLTVLVLLSSPYLRPAAVAGVCYYTVSSLQPVVQGYSLESAPQIMPLTPGPSVKLGCFSEAFGTAQNRSQGIGPDRKGRPECRGS